jgi:Fe-S-cluster-containing hydrogenase component 2
MKFDMPTCGGCRTCELACSYHHTGEFAPSVSSIKILDKEDGAGYYVLFLEDNEEKEKACDGCVHLDVPLCVEFCKKPEELIKMVKELPEKVRSKGREAEMNIRPAQGLR